MSTVVELNSTSKSSDNVVQVNSVPPQQSQHQQQQSTTTTTDSFSTNAVLQRMKELERLLQEEKDEKESLKEEHLKREERIKYLETLNSELNAEHVKDMRKTLETGIHDWLDSLDISEEMKKQVLQGITNTVEKGDKKDSGWSIVCNASQTHKKQLDKIEELVQQCNSKDKTIEELLKSRDDSSFSSAHSRISSALKRRMTTSEPSSLGDATKDSHSHNNVPQSDSSVNHVSKKQHISGGNGADAWDIFSGMISSESRNVYF